MVENCLLANNLGFIFAAISHSKTGQIYKLNVKLPNNKPSIHPICMPFTDYL